MLDNDLLNVGKLLIGRQLGNFFIRSHSYFGLAKNSKMIFY